MKTGMKVKFVGAFVIVLLLIILVSWWTLPIHVAKDLNSSNFRNMEIYDKEETKAVVYFSASSMPSNLDVQGKNGGSDDLEWLLEKMSKPQWKKSGFSIGMKDKGHKVVITGLDGKEMENFYVKSADTIIKGMFVYKSDSQDMCYEYIENLF